MKRQLPKPLVEVAAQIVNFGAFALVGLLCGCSYSKPSASIESKTSAQGFVATTAAAPADFAIDPIDLAPAKSADSMRPWLVLKSFGFFYDRADLATWEASKIAEIATYVAQHPGVELGVNRPAVAADGDPGIDDLNHRRVRTIINGLITAGVSEDRILVGNYRNLPLSLDQQVEVFVRRGL